MAQRSISFGSITDYHIYDDADFPESIIADGPISAAAAVDADHLVRKDGVLNAVDLFSSISGTANQIIVADDGDDTITLSTPQNLHTATNFIVNRLRLGTDTTFESFYQDEGDIYSEDGKMFMGRGINARAELFGVGLQLREHSPAVNLQYNIDATFTAATQTITKAGETFLSDGVEISMFAVVTDANETIGGEDLIGATAEIIDVTETTIVLSSATLGGTSFIDLTGLDFIVFNEPIVSFLDNGDLHMNIGENEEARFHINSVYGNNSVAVDFSLFAGIDNHTGVFINIDADTKNNVSGLGVNFDATAFASSDDLGLGIDILVNNSGATNGDFHGLNVSKTDPSDANLEVEAVSTTEGVAPIAQYLADAATLGFGYVYDDSGASYTDRTTEFGSAVSNVQIFVENDDQILLAALAKWDIINVLLNVNSSQSIKPVFEYITDTGTWVAFSPLDNTNGFKRDGNIVWAKDDLTTWGQRTVNEVTGDVGAVDHYWIRITRTRAVIAPNVPTESTITIQTLGSKFLWDENGDVFINTLALTDGVTAPSTVSGKAFTYIDRADGDYKIKFGDGTVKTLATDT